MATEWMPEEQWQALLRRDLGAEAFESLKDFWDEISEYVNEGDDTLLPKGVLQPPCGCQDCDARETLNHVYPFFRLLAVAEMGAMIEEVMASIAKGDAEDPNRYYSSTKHFLTGVAQTWSSQIESSSDDSDATPEPEADHEPWSFPGLVLVAEKPASSPTGSEGPTGH